jgi:RNA polymerase subunit RPABC4/transcription elongation factor Spt4
MDFESILNTVQPFVVMFAALFAAFLTAIWISVVIWTFRDIRARSRDIFAQILATLMVLLFFPFFPLPGWILYMLLRPRETLSEIYERSLEEEALLQGIEERMACPGCNRRIEEEFMICPTCHTRLKKACPACGRLLHLRWNLCPYCGAIQTATKPTPALAAQPVAMPLEPATEVAELPGTTPSRLTEPAPGAQAEATWEEPVEPATEEWTEPTPEAWTETVPEGWTEPAAEISTEPVEEPAAPPEAVPGPEPEDDSKSKAETLPFEFE